MELNIKYVCRYFRGNVWDDSNTNEICFPEKTFTVTFVRPGLFITFLKVSTENTLGGSG